MRAVPFAHGVEEALFALGLGFGLFAYVTLALGEAGAAPRRPCSGSRSPPRRWLGRREIVSGLARAARGVRRFVAAGSNVRADGRRRSVSSLLAVECLLGDGAGGRRRPDQVSARLPAHLRRGPARSYRRRGASGGTCSTSSTCSSPRRSCSAATCWRVSSTSRSACSRPCAVFSLGRRALRARGRHLGGDPLLHHAVHRHADDPGVGRVRAGALRAVLR